MDTSQKFTFTNPSWDSNTIGVKMVSAVGSEAFSVLCLRLAESLKEANLLVGVTYRKTS